MSQHRFATRNFLRGGVLLFGVVAFACSNAFSWVVQTPTAFAASGINRQIPFQGRVVNLNGTTVVTGSYSFTFSLYTVATGGAPIWTETKNLTVTNSIFGTNLGSSNPITSAVNFNQDGVYLGINFNGDGEMTPRLQIGAVAQAINAEKVSGLTVTDTTGTLTIPNSATISFGASFTTSADPLSLVTTGATSVTLPTTGVLATLAGTETFTNKTLGVTSFTGNLTPSGTIDLGATGNRFANLYVATADATTLTVSGNSTLGTVISGSWQGSVIAAQYGGTGLNTSGSTGIPVLAGGTWSVLANGSNTQCLIITAGVPAWGSCSSGGGVTGSGVTGQLSYWDSASTIANTAGLNWNAGASELGIGTASTIAPLTVRKASSGIVLAVRNTADNATVLSINSTGDISGNSLTVANGLTVSAGTVSLPAGEIGNAELANSSLTVSAGTNLTGGGSVALGGSTSISVIGNPSFATSVTAPTINATTALQLGGLDVNANGTLSNVAYLAQSNAFTQPLSVTSNAGNQISNRYNASNRLDISTSSAGVTSLTAVGSLPGIVLDATATGGTIQMSTPGGSVGILANGAISLGNSGLQTLTLDVSQVNIVDGADIVGDVTNAISGFDWHGRTIGETYGGTGLSSYATGDIIYATGANTLGKRAIGSNGDCLIVSAGIPTWGSCAQASNTLQAAYGNGNTITTTDAKDFAVTLANTTTDSNFIVNIATGSTGKFAVQNNGTDVFAVTSGSTTITSGGLTVTAGTVSLPAGEIGNTELANSSLTVTAGTGLSGGGAVSLGSSTTLSLPNVGSAATYGSASQVPVFTTDAQGRVTGVSATSIALAASAITTGQLAPNRGGTGFDSSASTGVPYISAGAWSAIANGSNNQCLVISGGVPTWGSCSAGGGVTGSGSSGTLTYWDSNTTIASASGLNFAAGALAIGTATTTNGTFTVTRGTSGIAMAVRNTTDSATTFSVSDTGAIIGTSLGLGSGTITSGTINGQTISAAANLTGSLTVANGLTVTSGTVSLPNGSIDNAELANASLTVTAGTNLTGGGSVALGSSTTLNVVNNPTFTGVVTASSAGTGLSVTNDVSIGGLLGVNGIDNSGAGIVDAGTISGATIDAGTNTITGLTNANLSGTAGISNANLANSSLTVTAGTNLSGGGSVSLGGSTTLNIVNNPTFTGLITGSNTGGTALSLTGAPAASATSSLLRLGNAIVGGDAAGTFIGLNAVGGYTGNLVDLQVNGVSKLSVNKDGNIVAGTINAGNLTAGTYNGQTISSSANFTGSLTVASGFTVTAGAVSLPNGSVANAALANSSLTVTAGTGLSGGGAVALGGSVSLSLPNVGSVGTYGSATQVPVFTTDAQGRITGVTNTTIAGVDSGTLDGLDSTDFLRSTASTTFSGTNARTLTVQSSLVAGARSSALVNITQADNATYDSTASLLSITNSDDASTVAPLTVTNNSTVGGAEGIRVVGFQGTTKLSGDNLTLENGVTGLSLTVTASGITSPIDTEEYAINLMREGTSQLKVVNTEVGQVADLNLLDGSLLTNNTTRLTNGGTLQNVTYNGSTIAAQYGGTGQASYAVGDLLYASGATTLSKLTAGVNGQCLVLASGVPSWSSCATASVTLQAAYDNGNTIALTNARNLAFTLQDTATDPNFLINIATGSTGKFAVQNNGTDVFSVTSGDIVSTLDITATGFQVQTGGSCSMFTATYLNFDPSCGGGAGISGDGTDVTVSPNASGSFYVTGSGSLGLVGATSGTVSITTQAAAGTYNFNLPTAAGTSGYFLTSAGGGATAMTWTDPSTLSVSTATNLAGGAAGNIPYQTGAGATSFVGGSAGQILSSNGSSAPTFINLASTLTQGSNISITGTTNPTIAVVSNPTFSGLVTGQAGLTVTGATVNLNASSNFATNIGTGTSTGAITLGGGLNTFAVDSTAFDVSTAGVISGITGITTSGGYTQSGSGANTFSGASTFSTTGANAVAITGAPAASATSSLLQLGSAVVGGSTAGTYLGVNSGSGFTGNFADFQVNGSSKLSVDYQGNLTTAGSINFNNMQLQMLSGTPAGSGSSSSLFFGRNRVTTDGGDASISSFGQSWTQRGSAQSYWTGVATSGDGRYLTGTVYGGQIYTSSDYGVTYTARDSNRNWNDVAISADGRYQTAAGDSTQIYTSSNYGATWTARDSSRTWKQVAMSADGKYQIAGETGANKVFTSSDYGATWTDRGAQGVASATQLAVSANGSKMAVAGNPARISSDYGVTWGNAATIAGGGSYYALALSDDGKRMVSAKYFGGISISEDFGTSWTTMSIGSGSWLRVKMSSDGSRMVTGNNNRAYVSSDYGLTWSNYPIASTFSAFNFENLDISADGKRIVVAPDSSPGYIYTSVAQENTLLANLTVNAGSAFQGSLLKVQSGGQDRFTISDSGSLAVTDAFLGKTFSVTGGVTTAYGQLTVAGGFTPLSSWNPVGTVTGLSEPSVSTTGQYQAAVKNGGKIYTSSDYGATWTARDSDRGWFEVAVSGGGQYQAAVVNSGQIYTSSDYGATWTARDSSRGWQDVAISDDGQYQAATVYGGQIYTSSNYGVTWTPRDSSRNWYDIAVSSTGQYQTAVVLSGLIYTSSDYGATWVSQDSSRVWTAVAMSDSGQYQTALKISTNQIYTSSDYGDNWTARDSSWSWSDVAISGDGTLQLVSASDGNGTYYIYKSTDYGVTWVTLGLTVNKAWQAIALSGDGKYGLVATSDYLYQSVPLTPSLIVSTGGASITGLITGNTGLTITGGVASINASSNFATNINTGTSTGAVTIGGGSNTFAVDSTALDISTAGAITGVTGITTSGAYTQSGSGANTLTGVTTFSAAGTALAVTNNATIGGTLNGQTISATASLTGTLSVATSVTSPIVNVGTAGASTGALNLSGATSGTVTIQTQAAAGTYNFNLPTTAGTSGYILTSGGGGAGAMTWTNPSALGVSWSSLTAPTGNLSLNMGTNTTAFDYATGTGSNNLFSLTTANSSNGTGYLLNIATGTSSTVKPLRVSAAGTDIITVAANGATVLAGTTTVSGALSATAAGTGLSVTNNISIGGQISLAGQILQRLNGSSTSPIERLAFGRTLLGSQSVDETAENFGALWTARDSNRNWTGIASSADGKYQAATVYGGNIYTSSNFGVTWTSRDSSRNWQDVAVSADGSRQTAVVDGGQIYTSSDYGATWAPQDSNRAWHAIAVSADGKYQTAAHYGGQIYTSSDYGATWTPRDSSRIWTSMAMSADGKYQSSTVWNDKIYVSSDYGATWTPKDSNRQWNEGIAMSANGAYQTAGVQSGQIYTSSDYGATWTGRDSSRNWNDMQISDDGARQVAGEYNGTIYVSTDFGVTWASKESSRYWNHFAMSADGKYMSATVDGGQIYTSVTEKTTQYAGLAVTGALSGSAGLTVTGGTINLNVSSNFATNINTGTSTGAITLGGGLNTFAVDSTALDISTAGAITGVTGITSSGSYTQSGSGANTLTGVTTLSAAGTALSVTNNASIGGTLSVGGVPNAGYATAFASSNTADLPGIYGIAYGTAAATYGNAGLRGTGYVTTGTGYGLGVYGVSDGPRAGGTNIGAYFTASGAASNYALLTGAGNVGIGTDTPLSALVVGGAGGVNAGFEIDVSTGITTQAYNRNTLGYATYNIDGSVINLRPGGSVTAAVSSGLLAVTGSVSSTTGFLTNNNQSYKAKNFAGTGVDIAYLDTADALQLIGRAGGINLNVAGAAAPITFTINGGEAARFSSTNRNLLVGTASDDGVNKLQVAGGIATTGGYTQSGSSANTFTGATSVTSGSLTVSNTSNSALSVTSTTGRADGILSGAAGNFRMYQMQTGGSIRWGIYTSSEAESGSNAGSNFGIARYDDAGAYLADAFTINRATGLTTIAGATTLSTSVTSPIVNVGTAGASTGALNLSGATSGTVTIQTQAAAGTYNFNLPTTAGTSGYVLTSAGGAGSPMTWTDPAALSVRWNSIASPTGNQSLTMGTNTTTWNYATGTSTNNLFNLTTDASANGTGALLNIQTGASSTVLPMRIRAGAVEGLLVDASGNVGVGTIAPGAKLSISTNGTSLLSLTHDATNGVISTSTGAINLQPASGTLAINKSGVQNRLRVYGSGGSVYGELTNDNTNTILTSSSGELQLQGTGTNQFILGSVGTAMNLVFEESATISGQGGNTITVGQSGDTFNLNASGVTYNVGTLTSTGATLNTSATGTVAFTINGPAGLTANLLNLAVNSSNRLTVTTAGALSTVSSLTSTLTGANALAITGAPQASATASLVQLGSTIAGGSASGTFLGLNATGGFAGNFVDFQVSGTNFFKVTSSGATSSAATSAVFAANSATESAFQATGTPTSNAAKSLLQLGSAIASGSTGGNYLGINSGSGFTGNFLELEKNGTQVLAVTADAQFNLTGAAIATTSWTQGNTSGFGSAANTAITGAITHNDALYYATTNTSTGTQIFRSTNGTSWTQVNTSGFGSANNTTAVLGSYAGTIYAATTNSSTGAQVWSSVDGSTWTQVNASGFGSASRTTATAITVFGGAAYVSTANGETFRSFNGTTWTLAADLGGSNGSGVRSFFSAQGYLYAASAASSGGAYLQRSQNGTTWSAVGSVGFGDTNNTEFASALYFNGAYYFGTKNTTSGTKLYRSYDLSTFTQVNGSGFGSANNTTVQSMVAYNGGLYAVTGNTSTGSQVYYSADGSSYSQVNTSGFGSSSSSTSYSALAFKGNLIVSVGNASVGTQIWYAQTGTIKSTTAGLAVKSAQIGDVLIENATIKGVSELTAGTISAQTIGVKSLQVADGIAVNSSPTFVGNLAEYKANDTTVLATTISGATKLSPWSFTSVLQTTTAESAFTDITSTANAGGAYNVYKNSGALNDRTYYGFSDSSFTSILYTETSGSGGATGFEVCTELTSGVCTTWTAISGGSDGTTGLTASGTVSWTNTLTKGTVSGISAYWVRLTVSSGMSVQANGRVRISSFETSLATDAGVAFMLQAPYTASVTGWSTNGTFIGANRETAFSGNFLDFRAAGTAVFSVSASGGITVAPTSVSTTLLSVTQIASQTADTIAVGKVFVVDTTGKLASSESLPGVPTVGVDPNSGATRGDLTTSSGPLRPFAGAGLTLNITAGAAYTADHYTSGSRTTVRRCVIPSDTSIAMTASTTEYVYLIASTTDTTTGKQCTVAKNATLPTFNAQYPVLVLAKVVSGASITSVADTRFFIGSTLVYAVSTSSVEPGSIVIQNTSVDGQVDDSSSAAATGVAGITAIGNTASGIFILNTSGTAWAQAVSGAARGVCAGTSTTTGSVNNITAAVTACAGRVMTNAASATPAVLVQISPN